MRMIIILMLLSFQAEAGEWFKTIEIEAGFGYESQSCNPATDQWRCGGYTYDIAEGEIFRGVVKQSIYSNKSFSAGIVYEHMSGIGSKQETPIDYFGVNLSIRHDWY